MPTETSGTGAPARVCVLASYATALVMGTERLPAAGETVTGKEFRQTHGGKGSDIAVQAARLGARVSVVSVVGDDDHGRGYRALLDAEGIETSGVRVDPTLPTGVGFVLKDDRARNMIVVDPGANASLGSADIAAGVGLLEAADVVVGQLESPAPVVLEALARARNTGATTVLNPAPAVPLAVLASAGDLSAVDVLTPNETEARALLGLADESVDPAECAVRLLSRGPRCVVVTCGEDGAVVADESGVRHVPAYVVDAVDSNGAGDSFTAALAVALGEGAAVDEAAAFAGVTAALCCEEWETVPSYQDRATVEAVLPGFLARAGLGVGASR